MGFIIVLTTLKKPQISSWFSTLAGCGPPVAGGPGELPVGEGDRLLKEDWVEVKVIYCSRESLSLHQDLESIPSFLPWNDHFRRFNFHFVGKISKVCHAQLWMALRWDLEISGMVSQTRGNGVLCMVYHCICMYSSRTCLIALHRRQFCFSHLLLGHGLSHKRGICTPKWSKLATKRWEQHGKTWSALGFKPAWCLMTISCCKKGGLLSRWRVWWVGAADCEGRGWSTYKVLPSGAWRIFGSSGCLAIWTWVGQRQFQCCSLRACQVVRNLTLGKLTAWARLRSRLQFWRSRLSCAFLDTTIAAA